MKCRDKIVILLTIILICLFAIYYGNNKVNYYVDEVWTYGLANHLSGIYPQVEEGAVYSGLGPFDDFVKVYNDNRFNYANVWKNQSEDVHPPFYYILINTVCSVFPDRYSKWYGISVNLFWMILLIPLLYRLSKEITSSSIAATGVTLAYGLSVAFMDTLVFIRMYTQLLLFTIALSYLIKRYWNKALNREFYFKLAMILILGMLSHYYFLIYAFAICLIFTIRLHIQKRRLEFKNTILAIVFSSVLYSIIWPQFWKHLLFGHRGRQAIYHAIIPKNIISGTLYMLSECNYEAFAGLAFIFVILGIFLLVIKKQKKESFASYNTFLLLSAVFYLVVVGTIAPFMDIRYIMNIIWIFILSAYVILRSLLLRKWNKRIIEYIVLIIFFLINFVNHSLYGWVVPNDYYYPQLSSVMESLKDYDTLVYVDEDWKPIIFFEEVQHAKNYIFINENNAQDVIDSIQGDFYLLTCVEEDKITSNLDAEMVFYRAGREYYFVNN